MATHRPLVLAVLVAGARLLASATASADEPGAELSWIAPEGCPSTAAVKAEVAKLLPNAPSSRSWQARGAVQKISDVRWTLHLSVEVLGHKDERDFVATSCAELAATAAVVLAIAVDPTRAATESPPPGPAPEPPPVAPMPEAVAPPPPVELPIPTPQPPPVVAPRERSAITRRSPLASFLASTAANGSLGVLGTPALGAILGLAWLPPHARFELDALWFPRSDVSGPVANTNGSFALAGATLTGCWLPPLGDRRRPMSVGPCLGAQGGTLSATGFGSAVKSSIPTSSPWVAATAGGLYTWRALSHLGLRAGVDLIVPFVRHTFGITHVDNIHTPSPVAAQASLGVDVPFP